MPKKTAQQKKTASNGRAFDEVDDRITIPVAAPAAASSSSVLLSGIDKYRNLNGRSATPTTASSSSSASLEKAASVHATFKSGMVAAIRSSSAAPAAVVKEPPLERAQRLVELKQYAAALPFFSEALHSPSASAQTKLTLFFQRGTCALSARRYKQAVEDFTHVIELTPSNALLLARRAKAYAALGQHQDALSDYSAAIVMTPPTQAELRMLLLARAAVLSQMGSISLALDDLNVAQTQTHGGERDPALFYQRAQLRVKCQQPRLAVEDLDKFMELQEDWTSASATNDDPDACAPPTTSEEESDEGRRLVDVRMERAALLLQLAKEADDIRRKDAAILAVEQGEQQPLLSDMPRDYQTSVSTTATARRRRQSKSETAALSNPAKPVDKKNHHKKVYDTLGYQGADAIALVERAVDDYTQILAADPAHTEALRLRGESMVKIGRPQDALHDFDAALALDKADYQVHIARATLLFSLEETKQAIEEMTSMLQQTGFFVDALFLRAEMYEAIGEYEKAKNDYSSIVNVEFDGKGVGDQVGGSNTEGISILFKSDQKKGSTITLPGSTGKVTNEYSIQALLLRARLCQQINDFDAAAADYKRILESVPNHLEAQYESQENEEKREEYIKQRELNALAWLEEMQLEEEKRVGGANSTGSAATALSGVSKTKKKKKAKKKKTGAGLTTPTTGESLDLEGDVDLVAVNGEEDMTELNIQVITDRRETQEQSLETFEAHRIEQTEAKVVEQQMSPTKSLRRRQDASSKVNGEISPLSKKSSFSSVSIVVTRDEACESMWEDHPDELELSMQLRKRRESPLSTDFYPLRMHGEEDAVDGHTNKADEDDLRIPRSNTMTDEDEEPDVEEPTPMEVVTVPEEERVEDTAVVSLDETASGGDEEIMVNKSTTPSHVAIRERLVDEKYLKKRQKQLDKLRVQLLEACETRDRAAIEEIVARVERKQMNDSLEEELAISTRVLQEMDAEAKRIEEEKLKQERYRQQERERERRKKIEDEEQRRNTEEQTLAKATFDKVSSTTKTKSLEPPEVSSGDERSGGGGVQKPSAPSLVIRPIAYGHALQVAEQHQQQLLQYQRLLQEKDAEIAYLRNVVAQSSIPAAAIGSEDVVVAGGEAIGKLLERVGNVEKSPAARRLDALVEWMNPSAEADDARFRILNFVRRVLERHWSNSMSLSLNMPPPPLLFVATGSFPMKTYLPTADLDVTLFLPKELEPTWHFTVLNALCMAGNTGSDDGSSAGVGPGGLITSSPDGKTTQSPAASGSPGMPAHTVRNVTVINAEVRVVKCTIDNISVDLTANRVGALGALLLLDAMDQRVGHDHLLKRSVILIKSWCFYESGGYASSAAASTNNSLGGLGGATTSVLGASNGALSTYAINTIVMSLFNQYGASITHPLHALLLFLDRMAEFPWHESALTLFGAVPLGVMATSGSLAAALEKLQKTGRGRNQASESDTNGSRSHMAMMTLDDVDQIRRHVHEQFGALDPSFMPAAPGTPGSTPSGSVSTTPVNSGGSAMTGFKLPSFPIRACNVVDPLDDQNNLARSVSLELFPSMKRAFWLGRNRLAKLLSVSPVTEDSVDDFFSTCWKTYGRGDGWRPDLLVHPRQTWHSRASSSANKDKYELKWQTLLPEFLLAPTPLGPMAAYAGEPHHPYAHYPQPHHHNNRHHHPHHYQQPHVGANGAMGNGAASINGHMPHHYQQGHNHSSPGHFPSHRSGSGGSGRYEGGVRSSPPGAHAYKSSPRRAQSLPGSASAAAQLAAVAAAASASIPNANGHVYPVSTTGVYDHPHAPRQGSHKGLRRYDSPTTTKHSASGHASR